MADPENTTPNQQPQISDANAFRKNGSRSQATNVELPSGLVVALKRPSITSLIKNGHIPADVAASIQNSKPTTTPSGADLVQYLKLQDIIAQHAIAAPIIVDNPNYDAGEAGLDDFDDNDKAFILNYVQSGVTDLTQFRTESQE